MDVQKCLTIKEPSSLIYFASEARHLEVDEEPYFESLPQQSSLSLTYAFLL